MGKELEGKPSWLDKCKGPEAGTILGFVRECGWMGVSKGKVEDEV